MICRMYDMRDKDVINLTDGTNIGTVGDVELDTATAKVISIVIYGKLKLFGLAGREEDIIVKWSDIEVIGEDTILVRCPVTYSNKKKMNFIRRFW